MMMAMCLGRRCASSRSSRRSSSWLAGWRNSGGFTLGFPEILRRARLAHVFFAYSLFALYLAKLTQALSACNRARFVRCNAENLVVGQFVESRCGAVV